MSEAFVYDAIRTPRGKGKKDGSLHEMKPVAIRRIGKSTRQEGTLRFFRLT